MRNPDMIEAEIRAYEILLKESDHTIVEALEGMLNCTSATGVTTYLKALPDEVKRTISLRKGYRQAIDECVAELSSTLNVDFVANNPDEDEDAATQAE